jgi:sugar phosphate isomerase/epimerase
MSNYSRRDFGKLAAAGVAASAFQPTSLFAQGKPNSKINGVQIGVISYSYRQMPDVTIPKMLDWMVADGISACEQENYQEIWAGAPTRPQMQRPPAPPPAAAGAPPAGAPPAGGRGGGGRQMTPEQQAANAKFTADMTQFRLNVPMSKYVELKNMFAAKGVSIYAFKAAITMAMSDAEADSIFNAAKACGCTHLTMEMPDGQPLLTKKIGDLAAKNKMMVGYHAHLQATPTTWDEAISQSPYNGINLDIGHFTAAGNGPEGALAFLEKNHAKITSMHMKDRTTKEHGEKNLPWGTGDTPITQALQMMKKNKWTFPATIELEYAIPEGSDSVKEVAKCYEYAKKALV